MKTRFFLAASIGIIVSLLVVLAMISTMMVGVPDTVQIPFTLPDYDSNSLPQTVDYSSYEPVTGLGTGVEQFEGNNMHVYNYSWSGSLTSFNLTVAGSVIVPPTVYDGLLLVDISGMTSMTGMNYMTQYYGGILAVSMENGDPVWNTTVPNMMMTQPLTYGGLVIIGLGNKDYQGYNPTVRGTGPNYVAALNISTGDIVWNFTTIGEDMPTPVIYDGLVIGANGNSLIYGLNASTGSEVWETSLPRGSYVSMSSLAVMNGAVYFGAADPYVFYCVNAANGKILWSTDLPAAGGLDDSSPSIWGNTVVTGYTITDSNASNMLQPVVVGMNATTGKVLWQVREAPGIAPPAIQVPPITIWNGVAYSDTPESATLYAVNVTTGSLLWTFKTGDETSNANIYDQDLLITNSSGTLFVLNTNTGALINEANVGADMGPGNIVLIGDYAVVWGTNDDIINLPLSEIIPSSG